MLKPLFCLKHVLISHAYASISPQACGHQLCLIKLHKCDQWTRSLASYLGSKARSSWKEVGCQLHVHFRPHQLHLGDWEMGISFPSPPVPILTVGVFLLLSCFFVLYLCHCWWAVFQLVTMRLHHKVWPKIIYFCYRSVESMVRPGKRLDLLFHNSARFVGTCHLNCHHCLTSNDTPTINGCSTMDFLSVYSICQ